MIVVFFSRLGIEHVAYLPEGETVTAEYFCSECLGGLFDKVKVRRKVTKLKDIIMHFDNAPSHKAKSTKLFLDLNGVKTLQHPPYSPDLSPCDFFLFGFLNQELEGTTLSGREDAIQKCNEILGKIEKKVFQHVWMEWKSRLVKCIEMEGDYIE